MYPAFLMAYLEPWIHRTCSWEINICEPAIGLRQVKMCLRACAKYTDSDSSYACAKSHPCICSPLMHSTVFNDSVSRQQNPDQTVTMSHYVRLIEILLPADKLLLVYVQPGLDFGYSYLSKNKLPPVKPQINYRICLILKTFTLTLYTRT